MELSDITMVHKPGLCEYRRPFVSPPLKRMMAALEANQKAHQEAQAAEIAYLRKPKK